MDDRTTSRAESLRSIRAALAYPAHYPDRYCWYVLACALDLMLTIHVMARAEAIELNGLAARAIDAAGSWGLIGLKVATILVVLAVCEVLANARPAQGRKLAEWAIAISTIPVVLTLVQLAVFGH